MNWGKKQDITLTATLLVIFLLLAYLSVFQASLPPSPWRPISYRLFFYHIPIAWTAYLSFGVLLVGCILFLRTRNMKWDMVAASAGEIGVLLTTLALLTGSVWSKAQLGYFWTWEDAKLFTTFILWMSYVAYLALRASLKGEKRARLSAVFGIISFVFVPLSFFASRWLQSVHTNLDRYPLPMINVAILLIGIAGFTLLFALLFKLRLGLLAVDSRLEVVKESMEETR